MEWIQRGNQREAVAQVVRKPLTSSEIYAFAREKAPKMRLHDVSVILRDFVRCGLGYFLDPTEVTGRLFFLTDLGRDVCYRAFGIQVDPLRLDVDWKAYARVVRARLKKWMLLQIATHHRNPHYPQSAPGIHKMLREKRKINYNATLRVLLELAADRLLFCKRMKNGRKLFRLSKQGKRVVCELVRYTSEEEVLRAAGLFDKESATQQPSAAVSPVNVGFEERSLSEEGVSEGFVSNAF